MTVVDVAFTGLRISESEHEDDGGEWRKWGTSQSPVQLVDWAHQKGANNACIAFKASGTPGGLELNASTGAGGAGSVDYTSGPKALLAQVAVTTYGLLDNTLHGAATLQIGSADTAYYDYYIFGSKRSYTPTYGPWVFLLLDPNEAAYRADTIGSPSLSAVEFYGWYIDIGSESSRSENVGVDSWSYLSKGDGLRIIGGTGSDTPATFKDALNYDHEIEANRWGVAIDAEGAIAVRGWLIAGNGGTAGCRLRSVRERLVFPETFAGEGFQGVKLDLGHAVSDFEIDDGSMTGLGRGFAKDVIHSQDDVYPLVNEASYSESNYDTDVEIRSGATTQVAQTFTTGSSPEPLEKAMFYLQRNASPTGNVTAYLYATSGGAPTGAALATSDTVDITTIDTSSALVEFNFDSYSLLGSTVYAIAVEFTGGDATNRLEAGVDDSSPSHAGTGYAYNGSWSSQTWDVCFYAQSGGDVVILDTSKNWQDLDYVYYSDEGGSDTIGLTDTNSYWIAYDSAFEGWALYTSRDDAATDTSRVSLSNGSSGENHSFLKTPDERPDLTMVGSAGIQATITGEVIENFRNITMVPDGTLDTCTIAKVNQLTQAGGSITDCRISDATTDLGEAFIDSSGLSGITDCAFTASQGHAISRAMTGAETLDGCSFTGYGPPHIVFDTELDVDGTNDEVDNVGHGFSTGDGVYYNDKGGTETIGLTDLARYFVRAVTVDSLSFHLTPEAAVAGTGKVGLTASGGGSGEDHHLYSADAALVIANGATAVTLSITNGASPSIRSTGTGVVTISNDVTLTVTVYDTAGVAVVDAQTAIYKQSDDTELMNEDTIAGGVATATYNYDALTPVYIRVRKSSTGTTRYKNKSAGGSITADGLSVTITLETESIS